MYLYEVGQPYNPAIPTWPEGGQYNYRRGGHELVLALRQPTAREVEAVRTGAVFVALAQPHPDLIMLLYRIGDAIPWSDAPYSWWMVPADQRTLPPPLAEMADVPDSARALLSITLVSAEDGIVRALRVVSLPPSLTVALSAAIHNLADRPEISRATYDSIVDRAYAHYPTSEALVAQAVARGRGGA